LRIIAVLSILLYGPSLALAQDGANSSGPPTDALQDQLDDQRQQIKRQQDQIAKQQESINSQTQLLRSMQTQLDQLAKAKDQEREPTEEDIEMKERLASLEAQISEIPEDPAAKMGEEGFPSSLRVPGTNAAYRIGGYVKFAYINSLDPIQSKDRFIVGSIPVENQEVAKVGANTSLTANQTRMNFDLREESKVGQFRAFVEGDFAAEGDAFRLRHAYGQFRDILTGKTWSTMYDARAHPDELDFEGINGQTILRQAQFRYFPSIGEKYDFAVALEDPATEATDYDYNDSDMDPSTFDAEATSSSDLPDIVGSFRRTWFNSWHLKTALVLRKLRAQSTWNPGLEQDTPGWGVSVSGVFNVPFWGDRDNIKFQLMGGRGVGRYFNDPNTLGGLDAVFAPDGSLDALPIYGGYAAFQHWWAQQMRSTFLFSLVSIDNYSYQPNDAYKQTSRASGNFIWSPIPRVDVGTELIWGRRTNKDNNDASALQWQFTTMYRF
jgi:hypothetical protein